MSETPPTEDWWQASDGRWYPPETHPSRQQAPVRPPPPGPPATRHGAGTPSPGAAGREPQPRRQRGRGCLVAAFATVVVLVAAAIGGVLLFRAFTRTVEEKAARVSGTASCSFFDERRAAAALGQPVRVVPLGGLLAGAAGTLDDRVLPDAPDCFLLLGDGATPRLVRVARGVGSSPGSAAAEYARDLAAARRTVPDRASGDPVLSFAARVDGLGDEAFCTGPDPNGSSGVLVRSGRELAYLSVGVDVGQVLGGGSQLPASPFGAEANAASCRLATLLARSVAAV